MCLEHSSCLDVPGTVPLFGCAWNTPPVWMWRVCLLYLFILVFYCALANLVLGACIALPLSLGSLSFGSLLILGGLFSFGSFSWVVLWKAALLLACSQHQHAAVGAEFRHTAQPTLLLNLRATKRSIPKTKRLRKMPKRSTS